MLYEWRDDILALYLDDMTGTKGAKINQVSLLISTYAMTLNSSILTRGKFYFPLNPYSEQ